jgi:hypothetical protein
MFFPAANGGRNKPETYPEDDPRAAKKRIVKLS